MNNARRLAGVVTGASGPEAGVWVIAETSDLPTKSAKIVVTDDQGRYLLPDLTQARYDVWVRGYGLVDSPKQRAEPGTTLNLQATATPNPRAVAVLEREVGEVRKDVDRLDEEMKSRFRVMLERVAAVEQRLAA